MPMKPEDLKRAPKLFCENVITGASQDGFIMGFSSGSQAQFYAFTPGHMKLLAQKLQYDVTEYEKQHGEITAEWSPNIVSPVQKANPPSEGS